MTSEAQARFDQQELRMHYAHMARCSEIQQAERIAQHYASVAQTAVHVLELLMLRKRLEEDNRQDLDAVIKFQTDAIKKAHRELGIELKWEEAP